MLYFTGIVECFHDTLRRSATKEKELIMMQVRRPMPNDRHRNHHTFHAVVVGYASHTTGMWWWKQDYTSLKVRFTDKDFAKFGEILERETRNEFGQYVQTPRQEVEVRYHSIAERNKFAIGEEVEVLFSTAGAIDQFFTRAQPFRWDGLRKKLQPVAA